MTGFVKNQKNLKDKLISYVGFAKKSRNVYFGADKVLETTKKGVIIVSRELSDNTLNKLNNHIVKTKSTIYQISNELMMYITMSDRIKVFQIIDKNLEKAVVECLKEMEDTTLE